MEKCHVSFVAAVMSKRRVAVCFEWNDEKEMKLGAQMKRETDEENVGVDDDDG